MTPLLECPALVVSVRLGGQRCAVDAKQVERAVRMVALSPIPDAPVDVAGLIDLHGELLPIVDLRARLGLSRTSPQLDHYLLIVHARTRFGLWVDGMERVGAPAQDGFERLADGGRAGGAIQALVRLGHDVLPLLTLEALDPGVLLAGRPVTA